MPRGFADGPEAKWERTKDLLVQRRLPEQQKDGTAIAKGGKNRLEGGSQALSTGRDKFENSSRWCRGQRSALWPTRDQRLEFRRETLNEVLHLEVIDPASGRIPKKIMASPN